jgi:hypothetical protein
MQPTRPQHPGTIVYVDGNTNAVVREGPAADVPESVRFADTEQGRVPVVRVVATTAGDQRFVREYGPAGELLRTTVQVRSPKT